VSVPAAARAAGAGRYRIGIDTGGTFTDLVLIDEQRGERRAVKVSSTPQQPSQAVFTALEEAAVPPEQVSLFVLGTTIATNALIQRKGQRTLFVTTAGFEDVPFIQRINRRSLFDLQWTKPKPYVDRPDCLGVRERVAADGTIVVPLSEDEVERVVAIAVRENERQPGGVAIAVCLLFSYLRPEHETMLARALRAALPDAPVSVSSTVAPVWREYERANTVIVDAHLRRLVGGFARELEAGLHARGVAARCFLLKSNGGQAPAAAAAEQPANLILSGLAGGMIAAQHFAELSGRPNAITLDMGGTSADVGVVDRGRIRSASQYEFEFGLPIAVPVIDLSTIGAGGSSIASFDQGGLLKVGPESAGADPGPAAYGKSGTQPTVTDANLVLGRLNPDFFLGGSIPLDAQRAHAAIETAAQQLGSSIEDAAQAIVELAVENMAGAVRLLAADRGLDFRHFDLMAFGGAGPLHGSLLARRVGLPAVITPPHPGLVSALGALAADLRVDKRVTKALRSDLTSDEELRSALSALAADALAELRREGEVDDPLLVLSASCRYLGQNFEQDVTVSLDAGADLLAQTVGRFHEVHERAYGYRIEDAAVEIVHLGAVAIQAGRPLPPIALREGTAATPVAQRPVYFKEEGWISVPIYRRELLGAQSVLHGPAIVEEMDTTILVLDRQRASVREGGILLIEEADGQRGGQPRVPATAREVVGG
jgi:N-methylhydantoinase A